MKRRLWQWFRNIKLPKKLTLVYVVLFGVACALALGALQISLNIYDRQLYEKSLQELDFFTQQVNDSMKEVEDLSYTLSMDGNIQQELAKARSMKYLSPEYVYEMSKVREMIMEKTVNHSVVKNVIYTDRDRMTFTVGTDTGAVGTAERNMILRQAEESRGGYVFLSPEASYPYLLSGRDCLEHLDTSLDYLGTMLITSDISGMIGEQIDELKAPHSTLYVYSQSGMIYHNGEDAGPKELPTVGTGQGYRVIRYRGQRYFMCYLTSAKNGWMYVNLFPYSEIFGRTMMVRYLMIVGFLAIFLGSALVMRKLADVIVKPLEQLSGSMQIVETGDFEGAKAVLSRESYRDESGLLTQEFRVMLDKISTLIRENYEEQLLLKDTKYKMLQAQINPHFLYNTLNTLNWMVKADRNDDASKVIIELGLLLRAAFAQEPMTTVAEEVRLAGSYITIQQFRYRNRAEFTMEAKGDLDAYLIPHMTLQPLVENAIYYGVDNSLEPCRVSVRVLEEENAIFLEVANTGPGMTREELEAVRNFTAKPKGHGIGLNNIRERLKMAFQNSEFTIESELDRGTVVRIRVEKRRRAEANV